MRIDTISIFPEMFGALQSGVVGRAIQSGILQLENWNPRDYSDDVHATVDDRPYGGGPGMVMMSHEQKTYPDLNKSTIKPNR